MPITVSLNKQSLQKASKKLKLFGKNLKSNIENDIEKATKKLIDNPNDQIQYFPSHIVVDENAEKESLSNIKFISGLDDNYKSNVENFLKIEVDLGVINSVPTAEQLYATI